MKTSYNLLVPNVKLVLNDCMIELKKTLPASVDAIITDPPYFLDQLKTNWDENMLDNVTENSRVTSLPAGMHFDPAQGREFQCFMHEVSKEALRVLKPGGFFLSFTAPRLSHRLGVAVEDAGFYVRDLWGWIYTKNQVKAMSINHFLAKREDISAEQKAALHDIFKTWKTPQIKSCIEPILCAQKPPEGTFLDNWIKYGVGLINTSCKTGMEANMFPANIMTVEKITGSLDRVFLVPKPSKKEKGPACKHISVKPAALIAHLIGLTTAKGAMILDPFNGSGSTGIAAAMTGRDYLGFELNQEYLQITTDRFESLFGAEWSKSKEDGVLSIETQLE